MKSFLSLDEDRYIYLTILQDDGNTALHLAAENGDITMARFLQSVKARPNVANNVRFVSFFGI